MCSEVKYPVGQQSFEQLRDGGFLYVDKTQYIEKIVNGSQYYFLGRPRRFGKSLFLSTLKSFFEGRRVLFKGLYIDSVDWDWEPYPVIYLDLNISRFQDDSDLIKILQNRLSYWEHQYGVETVEHNMTDTSVRFSNLIRAAYEHTGKSVVILVDEYDKPLVNNLHERQRFEMYRNLLTDLYSNFKSSAQYIRLVFLTGVSRFGKLSVFSGLNNISDISFDNAFAAVCGITEIELTENFRQGIADMAMAENQSEAEITRLLKKWYDGYHFCRQSPDIYNPYSLLCAFAKKEFNNFWIQSGTPSLLLEQLKRTHTDLEKLMNIEASETSLAGLDLDRINPVALFYQTGYLTIKDYDRRGKIYRLGIPNEEVKEGFMEYILPAYADLHSEDARVFSYRFLRDLEDGQVDEFMKRLKSMFAGIPYDLQIEMEHDVRNALFILFTLIGIEVNAEVKTSDGRIDILVRTDRFVYIMELKYDKTADEALEQIKRKEYALPWAIDNRTVIAIGINFSSAKRRIDSYVFETIPRLHIGDPLSGV